MAGVEGVFWRLRDIFGVTNGSSQAEKWTSVSPCHEGVGALAAHRLEGVRGRLLAPLGVAAQVECECKIEAKL